MNKEELKKEIKQLKIKAMLDKDEDSFIKYQNKLIDILLRDSEYIYEYKELPIFKIDDSAVWLKRKDRLDVCTIYLNLASSMYDNILCYGYFEEDPNTKVCFMDWDLRETKINKESIKYKENIGYLYNIDIYLLVKIIISIINRNFKSVNMTNTIIVIEHEHNTLFKFKISNLENYNNINKIMLSK